MSQLTKIDKELLQSVADLHSIPQGSYSIRKNGQKLSSNSSDEIQITSKKNKQVIIHEIPFEVNKAMLVRKIDEIRIDKKIDRMVSRSLWRSV